MEIFHNKFSNFNMENIYVILTVGGEGTRMYPLTLNCPKPLIDICNYPIIKRICEIFIVQGCRKFIFASKGYENSVRIKEVMGLGRDLIRRMQFHNIEISDLEFNYVPKYNDKGSADATRFAINFFNINTDVVVVGGDQIMDIDIKNMLNFHREKNALMTIGLMLVEDISQYGVSEVDENGKILKFIEKPKNNETKSRLANIGVYILSPKIKEIFKYANDVVKDFGKDLIPYLVNNNYDVYGFLHKYYWNDVGTPDRYLQTTFDILNGKLKNIKFNKNEERYEAIWIKDDTYNRIKEKINKGKILLNKPVRIGRNCDISEDVFIENSVIGDSVIIYKGCKIRNTVIGDFSIIEENCSINKTIIGKHTTIGKNSNIDADINEFTPTKSKTIVIGDDVEIYPNSILGPGKRVACIQHSHKILSTGKFITLGMDAKNVYFIEKE